MRILAGKFYLIFSSCKTSPNSTVLMLNSTVRKVPVQSKTYILIKNIWFSGEFPMEDCLAIVLRYWYPAHNLIPNRISSSCVKVAQTSTCPVNLPLSSRFTMLAQMRFMDRWGTANSTKSKMVKKHIMSATSRGHHGPRPWAPASAVPVARCCAVAPSQRFAALVLWPRPGLAQVAERRRRQMLTTTGLKIMRKDVQLKKDVHQIIRHLSWLYHS